MPKQRLTLLGSFQVSVDGEPVTGFLSNKVRALLAYLAVEKDRHHTRDSLAGLLWPESTDQDARASLRTALANLRKVIQDRQAQAPLIMASAQSIRFKPSANSWVDLQVFMDLTSKGAVGEGDSISQSRINAMERAADLCRGAFMEGFYLDNCLTFEEWLRMRREQVDRLLSETLRDLMAVYEQQGRIRPALRFGRRQLALEPWDERTHQRVMRLLAMSGNRSAALAQYEACRRVLGEELHVEPTDETSQLYLQIRNGDFEPAEEMTDPHMRRRQMPASSKEALQEVRFPRSLQEVGQDRVEHPLFVARQTELTRLEDHLQEVLTGKGRAVFIQGEPGSGKTALMNEFSHLAVGANQDLVVAKGIGGAYAGIGDPYQPFREALQMLSGTAGSEWTPAMISKENARRLWSMVPFTARAMLEAGPGLVDLVLPASELALSLRSAAPFEKDLLAVLAELSSRDLALDANHHPALFEEFTSVLQILSQERPLILILDDLQWIDRSSAALLFHLGRHLAGYRLLILAAYRPSEIDRGLGGEEHALKPVIQELARMSTGAIVDLDEADGGDFLETWIASQPNRLSQAFQDQLYRLTRGHPLFTIELMNDMQQTGDLIQDADGCWVEGKELDWARVPGKVEEVLAGRFQRLPRHDQDILSTASVEGETFTAEIVAEASGQSPQEVIDCLSGPLSKSHRIVEAQQTQRIAKRRLSQYRFRHSLFQRYFYQQLDSVKRPALHEAVGIALEKIVVGEDLKSNLAIRPVVTELARHFEAAGMERKAAEYLLLSGDHARQIHSHQEAIDHYQRALKLLRSLGDYERAARTLMKLGLMHHTLFHFDQARRVYAEGSELWQHIGHPSTVKLPPAPQPLRIEWEDMRTFDPAFVTDISSGEVNNQLFSGLLSQNAEGDLLPEAAASWDVLETGRRYVFKLRDHLRWSDGAPVTAKDFAFAWRRILEPATESPTASMLYSIRGAMAFHQGICQEPDSVGVKAIDDLTLQVDLAAPTSFFPYLVTLAPFKPVPQHIVEQWGHAWTEADKIQTNGPFRLQAWEAGHQARFERNPHYGGGFLGNLETVEFSLLPEWRDRLQRYEADDLDVLDATWLPPQEAEQLRLRHADQYICKPLAFTAYMGFDVSRPPFDDVRVRQAFGLAVDKGLLADVIGRGHLPPATGGFIPPGMPGHVEGIGLPYDPDQARRLLAEAGYPEGRGFPAFEYLIPRGAVVVDMEFMHNQWQKNLGLTIAFEVVGFMELLERLMENPPQLYAFSYVADYPDPDNFLRTSGFLNPTRWDNAAFNTLVDQALANSDQAERMELYRQAEEILMNEAPILPIVYGQQHLFLKPWVRSYPTSAGRGIHWKDVVILRE
jgi:ABC-type oligopeptide transport system substrate-binding subunit/DNA-binding SARP family transcriptional activator